MQMNDEVVSGWLEGSDSVDGLDNPAGSLYTQGVHTMEAALTRRNPLMVTGTGATMCSTSASAVNHCVCC